jgi:hypothetical protein
VPHTSPEQLFCGHSTPDARTRGPRQGVGNDGARQTDCSKRVRRSRQGDGYSAKNDDDSVWWVTAVDSGSDADGATSP